MRRKVQQLTLQTPKAEFEHQERIQSSFSAHVLRYQLIKQEQVRQLPHMQISESSGGLWLAE